MPDEKIDVERHAVRAILLTPDAEILLLRILSTEAVDPFWIAPGGGLEAGETGEEGLRRELWEELGLTNFVIGPLVWRRQHTFTWAGRRFLQHEQYHVVHVDRFTPIIIDEVEAKNIDEFRWWKAIDLEHAQERFTPLSLAAIVQRYVIHGPPSEPLPIEVLVD